MLHHALRLRMRILQRLLPSYLCLLQIVDLLLQQLDLLLQPCHLLSLLKWHRYIRWCSADGGTTSSGLQVCHGRSVGLLQLEVKVDNAFDAFGNRLEHDQPARRHAQTLVRCAPLSPTRSDSKHAEALTERTSVHTRARVESVGEGGSNGRTWQRWRRCLPGG